jgi:hypothetical protein
MKSCPLWEAFVSPSAGFKTLQTCFFACIINQSSLQSAMTHSYLFSKLMVHVPSLLRNHQDEKNNNFWKCNRLVISLIKCGNICTVYSSNRHHLHNKYVNVTLWTNFQYYTKMSPPFPPNYMRHWWWIWFRCWDSTSTVQPIYIWCYLGRRQVTFHSVLKTFCWDPNSRG